MLTVWIPDELQAALEQGVKLSDSDKSKFTRNAIRKLCSQIGVGIDARRTP